MTEIIDFKQALEQAAGNEGLAKELLGMLLQELPELEKKLRDAITEKDLSSCWDHAHKIYGSTAYCGVPALRESAQNMEVSVKAGEFPAIEENFTELVRQIESVLEHGKNVLDIEWSSQIS